MEESGKQRPERPKGRPASNPSQRSQLQRGSILSSPTIVLSPFERKEGPEDSPAQGLARALEPSLAEGSMLSPKVHRAARASQRRQQAWPTPQSAVAASPGSPSNQVRHIQNTPPRTVAWQEHTLLRDNDPPPETPFGHDPRDSESGDSESPDSETKAVTPRKLSRAERRKAAAEGRELLNRAKMSNGLCDIQIHFT